MSTEDLDSKTAPLIEHLAELRQRLIYSATAFIVGMIICFTVWNPIFNFLTEPLCSAMTARGHADCGLILIKLQEGFFVAVSISLLGGLILAFPYIAFQMWRFVAPGLYKTEKNAFLPFMIASPFMFMLGASFAYYVVTPLAFDFFLGFQQAGTDLSQDTDGNAIAGIAFQGTPPDVITQVILFVVVYGLYEISIFLVRRVETKREEQLRADGYYDDEDEFDDPLMKEFDEDEEDKDAK